MYVQSCDGSAERATAHFDVGSKGIQSCNPMPWSLLKMLLCAILSLMLSLSLTLSVVYGKRFGEHDAQIEKLTVDPYKEVDGWAVKHHAKGYPVGASGHGEISSSTSHIFTQNSAVFNTASKRARRKLHQSSKAKMNIFVKILEDLLQEELLKLHQKVLCLDEQADRELVALKERGFKDVHGIDLLRARLNARRTRTDKLAEDQNYDFVLTSMFDRMTHPAQFVTEIESAMKVEGFAAMHVSLNKWRNDYITSKSGGGIKPVTLLFQHSEIVYVSSAYAPGLDTVIVFKKIRHVEPTVINHMGMDRKQLIAHPVTIAQQIMNKAKFPSRHMLRKYSQDQQLVNDIRKSGGTDGQVRVEDTVIMHS